MSSRRRPKLAALERLERERDAACHERDQALAKLANLSDAAQRLVEWCSRSKHPNKTEMRARCARVRAEIKGTNEVG